jgi:hypothetical protein
MVDNDSPWWGPDKQEQSSQTSSDTPKNVFSGDVSSFSTPQAVNVTQMKDPNQFLISQFLIGLFLVPLIAGFLMSLIVLVIEPGDQDNWYYDSNYQPIFDDSVEINDEDYNTLTVDFNIPNIDLYEIEQYEREQLAISLNEEYEYEQEMQRRMDEEREKLEEQLQADFEDFCRNMALQGDDEHYE